MRPPNVSLFTRRRQLSTTALYVRHSQVPVLFRASLSSLLRLVQGSRIKLVVPWTQLPTGPALVSNSSLKPCSSCVEVGSLCLRRAETGESDMSPPSVDFWFPGSPSSFPTRSICWSSPGFLKCALQTGCWAAFYYCRSYVFVVVENFK